MSSSLLPVSYRPGVRRFARLAGQAGAVWLDSGNGSFSRGRFEIIARSPRASARVESVTRDGSYRIKGSDQQDLFELLDRWRVDQAAAEGELPFYGGTLGYLGYDIGRSLERLQAPGPDPTSLPVAWIGYYPWALVQDIQQQRAWLVADSEEAMTEARIGLAEMDTDGTESAEFLLRSNWHSSSSEAAHDRSIARIQQLIQAGDCYQVNLAQHFCAPYIGSPWQAYRLLRQHLPSPFSAFINTGEGCLMCHSPERFLLVDGRQVVTSPIKGTRPRGGTPEQDAALARNLLQSEKDHAENLMIVDLLRNDLGRSCLPGTVRADALFALESYPNVHHLVSTISGRLRGNVTPPEALRNAWPGGSVTGAPKIRAMDIINSLEPVARSAYCGSVFYYSNHGRLDSNIAIRSLVADASHIHCWGGGGIVADSVPSAEYAESLTKIEVLMNALPRQ